MINASQAFKQKLENDERAYLEKVDITLANNTVLRLTNSDLWSGSLTFEDSVGSDSSFSALGSCIINSLRFTINNIYDDFSDIDFTDAAAIAYIGLDIEGTPEWLRKGTYTVSETTYNGSTIALKMLDNMEKFDKPYSESTLIYPATLDTIVRNLCTVCGVTLASSSLNFPRKDYVIQTRPSDKATTCREVLSWCATIAGCFARCDRFGELELRWFDQNNMHELSSLYSQNISVDDVVITQIQAEVKAPSEDASESIQTYTSGTAGYAIKIAKNDFITPTNAQYIVNTLGTELIGLTFRKANISHSSDPTIEAGDCGTVIDRKENEYPILITRTNFKVGSSQTTVCGAETPARNSATRYTEATKSYVELRERIKKVDNPYAQAMSDLAAAVSSASGMYETEVPQPGGGVITYWHNKPLLAESDIQIMISDAGMTFTNTGTSPSPTWYGFTMDGDILASVLDVVGINADWINTGQLVVKDANQNETLFVDVDTGTVRINASQLSINSQTINSMIDEASGLTLQTPYTWSNNNQTANFSAIVYQGKEDITADCDASWFEWYLRKEGSETRIAIGKTVSVSKSSLGYGGTVVCKFTSYDQTTPLLTRSGAALETRSGNQLSTFSATATGEQKITDLPQKTAASQISASDNLLGIDVADGYQVSVRFFTDYVLETQTRTINGQSQTVVASINALGSAQTALAGRMNTTEGNITSLTGRMTTAEGTIATHTADIATNADDIDALESSKVDRAGDTMTGNLYVRDANVIVTPDDSGTTNHMYVCNTREVIGTPPSATRSSGGYILSDINGVSIGRLDAYFYADDYEGVRIGAARTPTGGTAVGNYLIITVDANGNRRVNVSQIAPWCDALNIGSITEKQAATSGSFTLKSATATAITNMSLTAGTYIITGTVAFNSKGDTTYRTVRLGSTSTGNQYGHVQVAAVSNGNTQAQVVALVRLTATSTVYLSAAQGAGSDVTVPKATCMMKAVKVGIHS